MVDVFPCRRAEIFHNPRRLTPAQIKAQTGCSHIINGWVFHTKTFAPLNWTVIEGRTLSRDEYRDWGVQICEDGRPCMGTDRERNYLSAVPILKDGKKLQRSLTPDVARKAARSAVGWTREGNVLLWCDKAALTRESLQEKLLKLGAVDGLMLDGGGSTQGIFPGGKVTSSRKVPTFLLFWESDNEPEGGEPVFEVRAYSRKKEGAVKLSANFKVSEFACRDGSDAVFVAPKLIEVLQGIRDHFRAAVVVSSGYRTPTHNAKEGGSPTSQHLYGTAADIVVRGKTPAAVGAYARQTMPNYGGVGIYAKRGFVHVDVREKRADWVG